jgi:divalent metal cation (Fe/Co/Zn/Cd) transporter
LATRPPHACDFQPASASRAALVADGHHARVDGFASLGVVAAAGVVAITYSPGSNTMVLDTITCITLHV